MSATPRTRALSLRAASECENALYPTCKCRCGGALHGAARVRDPRTLPLDDPHSPSRECPKCRGTGKLSGWAYDAEKGYDAPTEYACWKCKGAGRVLERAVQQAELPAEPTLPVESLGVVATENRIPSPPGHGPAGLTSHD